MSAYFIKPEIRVVPFDELAVRHYQLGEDLLVLVSGSVRKFHDLDQIFNALRSDHTVSVYDHIRPDAHFEDLDIILKSEQHRKPSGIIAVGGGSVIDAAKALSVAFGGVDYKEVFHGRAPMPDKKIRLLAVPTTAGTGAELSFGAILYDEAAGTKGGLRGEIVQPDGVIIDARLHNSAPASLKAEVGFDCLTHAVETYISQKSNPLVRQQSVNCLRTIFDLLPDVCLSNSLHAMRQVAIVSSLMGINLAYSSTCLPHRIQYVIGPLTGTSHAQGLIALYKGWLKNLLDRNIREFLDLANDLRMKPVELFERINGLKQELEIDYSLTDLGVKSEQVNWIAENIQGNLTADPSFVDRHTITTILNLSL